MAYSIYMGLILLIFLLDLYGPFVLLFCLPVPFTILPIIFFRKFSIQTELFLPRLLSRDICIRGPPAV